MPVLLIVDEADMLKAETLHDARQLCDSTRTPLVLAGTRLLEARLQRDPRLRPLATRVATQIELGAVTLKDLQAALPDLAEQVVLAIWQAGRGQFRTITLLLKELHKFQEANPGRRLTRKAVALAAEHLLAAVPIPPMAEEEPATVPESLAATAPAPLRMGRAVAAALPARVAARAG
jgi:DNA transposition AAA+ family ATPase